MKTWKEGITDDARELGVRNWKTAVADRDEWRQKLKTARAVVS